MDQHLRILQRLAQSTNDVDSWSRYANALERSMTGAVSTDELQIYCLRRFDTDDYEGNYVCGVAATEQAINRFVREWFTDLYSDMEDAAIIPDSWDYKQIIEDHNNNNDTVFYDVDVESLLF